MATKIECWKADTDGKQFPTRREAMKYDLEHDIENHLAIYKSSTAPMPSPDMLDWCRKWVKLEDQYTAVIASSDDASLQKSEVLRDILGTLTCEGCGLTDATVEAGHDPFAEDVHGEIVDVIYCPACYRSSADEI